MSVQTQISRISAARDAALAAVADKGVTVPSGTTLDGLASLIARISGGYGDVPTYHFVESARVLENIANFKAAHPNHLIFGAVSDIHVDDDFASGGPDTRDAIRHAAFGLEMVGAMAECDFIVNLGDNCEEQHIDPENTSRECGLHNAIYSINALRPAFDRLTSFNLVGNHDKTLLVSTTILMCALLPKSAVLATRTSPAKKCASSY